MENKQSLVSHNATSTTTNSSSSSTIISTKEELKDESRPSSPIETKMESVPETVEETMTDSEDVIKMPPHNTKRKILTSDDEDDDDTAGSEQEQKQIESSKNNKKIKTENDCDSSRNGFNGGNDLNSSTLVTTNSDGGDQEQNKVAMDNDDVHKDDDDDFDVERYSSTENIIEYLENELRESAQLAYDLMVEEYFLYNDIGKFIDFPSIKKRLDLNLLGQYIYHTCEKYHNIELFNYIRSEISEGLRQFAIPPPPSIVADTEQSTLDITATSTTAAATTTTTTTGAVGDVPSNKNVTNIAPENDSTAPITVVPKISASHITNDNSVASVAESAAAAVENQLKKEDKLDDSSLSNNNVNINKKLPISASLEEANIRSREQIVQIAKKEAYVQQRVAELRKNGVWSDKRLPKLQDKVRIKYHWDYLLEEMQWLAVDFAQERKWKRNSAKKCARLAMKHVQFKNCQDERVEKEEQMRLKRIASNICKMVKTFWSDIQKIVEAKQEVQLKEKRKKIHDMHLRFIVDKADHLTETLAQELIIPMKSSKTSSVCSDQESTTNDGSMDDDEFEKGSMCSDDDEETIAKEEKNGQPVDHTEEINALSAESEMPIDEIIKIYYSEKNVNDQVDHQEQQEQDVDDSTTLDEETENNNHGIEDDGEEDDGDDEDDDENDEDSSETDQDDQDEECDSKDNVETQRNNNNNNNDTNDQLNDIAAGAESLQPKGNTFQSVQVITKVPFLLKYELREYQHIGLDWLVAMYEKNLNGILADEMGLGKTIQTIALIAHLACEKGIWGPHLIIVPTSVMLNWEMEFKKWCPALKILTYFGNPKERKLKRKGWTKPDSFHVCITSYKLVIQDHQSFRRQKWIYLILDEAHNIKNFKSQRWQMLLNFNSTHRLLLTGTPLQNNLMELWSLMHFLMPNVFQSHREFKDWFDRPMAGMIEGQNEYNDTLIRRLHKVLRPFLLRRLKCDVEKQLPKKYEHIVRCPLSKRQRYLYDEFMSLGDTKETLATGSFLSVINILMQLRKVCNHPNLFEPRPTISPFIDDGMMLNIPGIVTTIMDYDPLKHVDWLTNQLIVPYMKNHCKILSSCFNAFEMKSAINNCEDQIYVRLNNYKDFHRYMSGYPKLSSNTAAGATTVLTIPQQLQAKLITSNNQIKISAIKNLDNNNAATKNASLQPKNPSLMPSHHSYKIFNPKILVDKPKISLEDVQINIVKSNDRPETRERLLGNGKFARIEYVEKLKTIFNEKLNRLAQYNRNRCQGNDRVCLDLLELIDFINKHNLFELSSKRDNDNFSHFINGLTYARRGQSSKDGGSNTIDIWNSTNHLNELVYTPRTLVDEIQELMKRYIFSVPSVVATQVRISISHQKSYKKIDQINWIAKLEERFTPETFDVLTIPKIQTRLQLPEIRLIQYDCGKLQVLDKLLWQLKSEKHRVLIFTQMSKMLDILEQFLNYHGHTYLRLDGTTKIDQRQVLMERFNADPRIFCFILSTRSGGIGVNLTGADTVIFYDSDWNPTMDAQAQDRCHRIGQTRDVHIYRLISERTVEENILKKAKQKKMLGDMAIEEGNFTTAFFKQNAIKDLFDVDENVSCEATISEPVMLETTDETSAEVRSPGAVNSAFEQALGTAEEESDVKAAKIVRAEVAAELDEFDENIPIEEIGDEKSPEEEQIEELISQLNPLERYALKFLESSQDFHELKQAEEEIEETKKQWQKSITEWKKNHDKNSKRILDEFDESIMTCSREDASITKVFLSLHCSEPMPIWAPPTPPQEDENDLYVDYSMVISYEKTLMTESQLPPVYVPKESNKRARIAGPPCKPVYNHSINNNANMQNVSIPSPLSALHSKPTSRWLDDLYSITKSPFDRTTSPIGRLRQNILSIKMKLWPGGQHFVSFCNKAMSAGGAIPQTQLPSTTNYSKTHLNLLPKFSINEEFAMIHALLFLQDLPFNLCNVFPAHTPNWDFITEQVNSMNYFKRGYKFCKFQMESMLSYKDDLRIFADVVDTAMNSKNSGMVKQTKSSKKAAKQALLQQQQQLQQLQQQQQQQQPLQAILPVNFPQTYPLLSNTINVQAIASPANPVNVSNKQQQLNAHNGQVISQQIRIAQVIRSKIVDDNKQFSIDMTQRFAAIKQIVINKTQTSKSLFKKQRQKFDCSGIFLDHNINFDNPLSVPKVAIQRSERINREKQAREMEKQVAIEYSQSIRQSPQYRAHIAGQQNAVAVGGGGGGINVAVAPVANVSHAQSQQPQPQQIIINQSAATAAGQPQTFVAAGPSVQQIISQKLNSKLQNLVAITGDGSVGNVSEANLVPPNIVKFLNSQQLSQSQTSQTQNVHHVSLTQAQSMGLISQGVTSIASLPQSTSVENQPTVSTFAQFQQPNALQNQQQQQQQQSTQTAQQFLIQQSGAGGAQAVPVNVSHIGQQQQQQQQQQQSQQQIPHKLFAITNPAGNNAGSNITQVAPQMLASGQLNRPVRQVFLRQGNRQQLLQQQASLQGTSIQVSAQPRHLHMQSLRGQAVAAGSIPTQRLQLLPHSLIGNKIIATTLITSTPTNTSNSPTSSALIGSQNTMTSASAAATAISSHLTAVQNKAGNGSNHPLITRTFRKDGVSVAQLKQNLLATQQQQQQQSAQQQQSSGQLNATGLMAQVAGQSSAQHFAANQSQQTTIQQHPTTSSSNEVHATHQSISLPANIVKTISSNIPIQATLSSNANTFTLPTGQITTSGGNHKILNQTQAFTPTGQLRFVARPTSKTVATTTTTNNQSLTGSSVGGGGGDQPQTNRSANIITPMFPQSATAGGGKSNMFHFVSTSNGQQLQQQSQQQQLLQPSTISVNKTILSAAQLQQAHGPLKGNIIVQQQQPPVSQNSASSQTGNGSQTGGNGSVNPLSAATTNNTAAAAASSMSHSSSANYILAQPQHLPSSVKNSGGAGAGGNSTSQQQHFIAVSSNDSSVNATTIKLLPTSAGTLTIQQQQQPTTTQGQQQVQQQQHTGSSQVTGGNQQTTISTPKGHIIISGHGASIMGQSVQNTGGSTTNLTAIPASPTILQQVVNSQTSSNSNQTLTFAIRTTSAAGGGGGVIHGQSLGQAQGSANTVHLSTLTLKNPSSSNVNIQQVNNTTNATSTVGQQTTSALVAALSQSSNSNDQTATAGSTTVTAASSALLRSLASSNVSAKAIPIVLMQSSQNPNMITQTTSGAAVSLINIGNTVTNSGNQTRQVVSNKITTATQTSGATLGSILSAAAKASGSVQSESQYTSTTSTATTATPTTNIHVNKSSSQESPLIEALMSSSSSNRKQSIVLPKDQSNTSGTDHHHHDNTSKENT